MKRDFTLDSYSDLLNAFKKTGYSFFTFEQFCEGKAKGNYVVLRHDVDLKPRNSLAVAQLEAEMGISSSYYFRVVPQSNHPEIIKQIASLNHEIGYHYEDLSFFKGNQEKALNHFQEKLQYFRLFYPVKTICMHGSPTSKIDNRMIWKNNSYKDFGIIGEPYFDVNFNKVLYLTDTGRTWDGEKYSVRDKVESGYSFHFQYTTELVDAVLQGNLPNQIMITTHPQRWTNKMLPWINEYIAQSLKNKIKQFLVH